MNEVTKIHLSRQAYTISVDAHHELRAYLDAIKHQVKDKEVIDEIEIRMTELLAEHGINDNKVILSADVAFLKEQLGSPKDFSENSDEDYISNENIPERKRLFRDTDNAMIAGVSAGLAEYFGLDVLLVRIVFVIVTLITVGWAILLYIIIWLLVPEAKTPSDRLQMAGKPVTVDSLKEIVERADVRGAAHNASNTLAGPINTLFRLVLKVAGIFFILFGLSAVFGLIAAGAYVVFHSGTLLQDNIFPIGFRQDLLLDISLIVAGLVAVFVIIFGIAIFRRKWPIHTWVTGILVGFIFIGLATGAALGADVYPNIRNQYNANVHNTIRNTKPFTNVYLSGGAGVNVNFVYSTSYYISFNYYGYPNLNTINTNVKNGTLTIDTSQFNPNRSCPTICIPHTYNMNIYVYSPIPDQLQNSFSNNWGVTPFAPPIPKMFNN